MKDENIVLIGMSGVGKSTIGKLLSKNLRLSFVDLDEYITEKEGKPPQVIIDENGEQFMLNLEKQRMYEIKLDKIVVAPGGSIIYHPDLMDYLKQNSTLVYLKDSFENIEARLKDVSRRAIIGIKDKSLKELYEERKIIYSRYADVTIDCQGKSEEQIVKEISSQLTNK